MRFGEDYFRKIYDENSLIDGDFNAKSHVDYLKATFKLLEFPLETVADFGFGKAKVFYELYRTLKPKSLYGLEVSEFAFQNLNDSGWLKRSSGVEIENIGLCDFVPPEASFDIGVCNSVLQYIPDVELEKAVSILAYSCKYIYLHVPTKEDYGKLEESLNFKDPYALQRSDKEYRDLFSYYFTPVSWGIMESKYLVENMNSCFFDSLYRFDF
ncbi:MAG: class I SAM-dependent methyltransferase [Bdellovibrionales bacterium]